MSPVTARVDGKVMPLAYLAPGEKGEIVGIHGGKGLARRLYELGLTPGRVVEVLSSGPGPTLVRVNGATVLAIGRGVAARVIVRRVE
ncbi:FeoA family protein [Stetteria hydrogenophila]